MANNYNVYPYTTDQEQTFTAFVDKGEIIKINRGKETIVGLTIGEHETRLAEVETQRDEFYNKLVECGIIEVEKTPEEQMQETMNKILDKLTVIESKNVELEAANKALSSKVKNLEKGSDKDEQPKNAGGKIPKTTNTEKV